MNSKESIALYAFSGDPITYGHEDIIKRIAPKYDKVIVGIGVNPDKKHFFSLQERREMAKDALLDILNVEVVDFKGLLSTFATEQNVDLIIRGIRNTTDMEAEKQLFLALKTQKMPIDIACLFCSPDKEHISSSTAKVILKENGKIHEFVRLNVKQAMEAKMNGYYSVGITGEIGSGKSYIANQLVQFGNTFGVATTNIEMDKIGHEILGELQEPIYVSTREKIIKEFGEEVRLSNNFINRKALGKIIFEDSSKREKLNELMQTAIAVRFERLGYKSSGLHLINAALLIEADSTYRTNNNTIIVETDEKTQIQRINQRDNLDSDQIKRRIESQFSTEKKKSLLQERIKKDNRGTMINYQNYNNTNPDQIAELFFQTLIASDIDGGLRVKGLLKRNNIQGDYDKIFKDIQSLYFQNENFYHHRLHIISCLNDFYEIRNISENPDALELAIIFHDIVYIPGASDNEEKSAELADKYLSNLGYDANFIAQVKHLIMMTKHDKVPQTMDEKIIIDIDLAILGKDNKFYKRYISNIREEYKRNIPGLTNVKFNQGRLAFLEDFSNRENIYHTPYFQNKYGNQVKENLEYEKQNLK
ncbi:pantetheine-phosphate adenylyltransferase [Candidatus Gracilibacteria bacterium]|nr:pantetheine-phosphate adenylyltransferase [Candidatus Gracilibacteria bacterium]